MFRKIIWVIFIVAAISGTYYLLPRSNEITNYPSSGEEIVAFGDSLVEGVGSSKPGGFVSMLSKDLSLPIINLGKSGDTTADALSRVGEISKYDPKIVIILLGGNDFLRRVSEGETLANLDQIISKVHEMGSVVVLVGLEGEVFNKNQRQVFESLVEKHKTAYVPDILHDIFGRTEFMSDSLHPNDSGYRIMSDRIKVVLEDLI